MRTATVAASALAFAASAFAQTAGFAVMSTPAKDEDVPAGSVYNIKWAAGTYTGLVDVILMAGKTPETLQLGDKIYEYLMTRFITGLSHTVIDRDFEHDRHFEHPSISHANLNRSSSLFF